MNLTGDSKLGPYLTLTLFFLRDKKISFAEIVEKENREKRNTISLIKIFLLSIFNFF